jgi:oligopeptidase B
MKSTHCGSNIIGPAMFTMSYIWTSIYQKKVSLDRSLCTVAVPCAKKIPSFVNFGVNLKDPTELRGTGDVMNPPIQSINDPYNWMRDETRKDEIVLNHLIEENNYCNDQMKHLEPLQKTLYNEILHHLKETDEEVPFPHGNYEYYSRTVKGLSYKIYCRRLLNGGNEEIVLDENEVAKGKEYCVVGDHTPSPDHSLLAYSVDDTGYETYKLYFKNIQTGELIGDVLEGISGEILWGGDSSTLFYMKMDDEHRPYRAFMHILGTKQSEDICFLTENDQRYWMGRIYMSL